MSMKKTRVHLRRQTWVAKNGEVAKGWHQVDATDVSLGRLAVEVATVLMGKHKPTYTPHVDCGDNIIIVNAEKVRLTGRKTADKIYYWHTGWPGGIKSRTAGSVLAGKHPERVVIKAVERMVNRGRLGRQQLKKLHVYKGADHPHQAQSPEFLDVAAMNPKNKRSA